MALTSYVDGGSSPANRSRIFAWLLGPRQPAGFGVAVLGAGERVELVGRHRFSRYRLVFSLPDAAGPTTLSATTYAAFPGPHGAAYRLLVIRTRLHVVATRRMLDAVRDRAWLADLGACARRPPSNDGSSSTSQRTTRPLSRRRPHAPDRPDRGLAVPAYVVRAFREALERAAARAASTA